MKINRSFTEYVSYYYRWFFLFEQLINAWYFLLRSCENIGKSTINNWFSLNTRIISLNWKNVLRIYTFLEVDEHIKYEVSMSPFLITRNRSFVKSNFFVSILFLILIKIILVSTIAIFCSIHHRKCISNCKNTITRSN